MIELRGISKYVGGRRLLDDVNMQVQAGEAVAVVGESGAGKTTLGRILLALLDPSRGQYLYEGEDVVGMRAERKRRWRADVQAVFQNPLASLNPRLRIDIQVVEPLAAVTTMTRRSRRKHAQELLERVGLRSTLVDRYPHQLSGGERQRVAIARSLSSSPKMLVLDEPASALDVSARGQILNLLRDIRTDLGTTYIYISHDLATVRLLCDRAYVLYSGLVFEELDVEALTSNPVNPYSRVLLQAATYNRGHPPPMRELPRIPDRHRLDCCPFIGRCEVPFAACTTSAPPMREVAAGHRSRCHHDPLELSARAQPINPENHSTESRLTP